MKQFLRLAYTLPTIALIASPLAQGADSDKETPPGDYSPLLPTRAYNGYPTLAQPGGVVQLGLQYNGSDNHMAGQYNGRDTQGTQLIGNLRWREVDGESYWRTDISDLGTNLREGSVTWGRGDRIKITLGVDSQSQVRNDTGRSPLQGDSDLRLPGDWVSAPVTGGFTALVATAQPVDQSLDRDKLSLGLSYRLNDQWALESHLSHENRSGTTIRGAGIYIDAATADAVLLPVSIDYDTTEIDLGLAFTGKTFYLKGVLDYSEFDNRDNLQTWQNPYSGYGPDVRYPDGTGGLGLAPDNEQLRGRLTGHYIASSTARLQFDASYALLSQDQAFADYTVNPNLTQALLPREDFDGEVAVGTVNVALLWQPAPRWNVKAYVDARDRDYDVPRDGYTYNRGDATGSPREALTVYNTAHDYRSETAGIDLDWRLPLRSRLSLDYAYERVTRRNAAVEETEEDQYTLAYRIQPVRNLTLKLEATYQDRRADTYQWDQRYYALLDVNLINATPDNQRYINHPELSQYHLSNRERGEAGLEVTWQPDDRWHLAGNLLWREDEFDQTHLGLNESQWQRAHLSASYTASASLTATVYGGFDRYESDQTGRAFRGGQDKNAFALYTPLPQASDPARDWHLAARDDAMSLGASVQWQASERLAFNADYTFVDTASQQSYDSAQLDVEDLPDVDTRLHQITASGTWQQSPQLSWRLDYQYYRYNSNDFRYTGQLTSIDKVLTLGQSSPRETIHYMGASVIYRWQ